MTANVLPWYRGAGIYWTYFISNDLQFYLVVLLPTIFVYQRDGGRVWSTIYPIVLITISIVYIITITWLFDYSTLFDIEGNQMPIKLVRRPFAPVGFYAMGVIASIYYYEYT